MTRISTACTRTAILAAFVAAGFTTPSLPAAAQAIRTERALSLDLATQIAQGAVAACQAMGHAVTATVVDRAGLPRASLRGDNANAHTIGSAQQKAWTAASMRVATGVAMENAQKNPGAANLWQIPGVILLAGGVPIRAGNEVLGGVGVGGAPAGSIDERCANAGIEKVRDQLR